MAQRAALRSGTGIREMTTVIRSVQASAAAAEATALSLKQSSQTHSSSRPAWSLAVATDRSRVGGRVGTKLMPSLVIGTTMPGGTDTGSVRFGVL